jgi:hypothetical protein
MSLSRKVVMGREERGTPWTLNTLKPVKGTGENNQYRYEDDDLYYRGLVFNSDGTIAIVQVYSVTTPSTTYLWKFTLDKPYILPTGTRVQTVTLNATNASYIGLRMSPDGTKFYMCTTTTLLQVEFATAFDLSSTKTETIISSTVDPSTNGYNRIGVFNSDGTKYYAFPSTGTAIKVFDLTTAYDLSSGVTAGTDITSISGNGFSTVAETGFSHDGSVLFIHDSSLEFSSVELTTAYDLTTLDWTTLDSTSNKIVIGSQGALRSPGFAFCVASSSSVTRIFTMENGISSSIASGGPTTSLDTFLPEFSSSVLTPDTYGEPEVDTTQVCHEMSFNADGTRAFLFTFDNTYGSIDIIRIKKYDMTTAYDLSTASYAGITNITPSDFPTSFINGLSISNDGSNMYVFAGDFMYTWNWATAYNYTAVGYSHIDRINHGPLSPFAGCRGVVQNDDGTELTFAVGDSTNKGGTQDDIGVLPFGLYTVSLSTAGDPGTADTSGIGYMIYDRTGEDEDDFDNCGFEFNSDGSEWYSYNRDNDRIKYGVPGANYGVNGATGTIDDVLPRSTTDFGNSSASLQSFQFNSDGTKFFALNSQTKCIQTFTLSTAYDVSSLTEFMPKCVFRREDQGSTFDSFTMNPAGTKLQLLNNTIVSQYTLSTAFDLSTASATRDTTTLTVDSDGGGDIAWGDSGNYFYRMTDASSNATIKRYSCSTAYDITTANSTPDKTFTFGSYTVGTLTGQRKMFFKPDGLKLYTFALSFNSNQEYVWQWDLSTAWDISTISSTTTPDAYRGLSLVNDDSANGLYFTSDGLTLIIVQQLYFYKFALTTAWDLSTINTTPTQQYAKSAMPIGGSAEHGMFITSDGTKMFLGDQYRIIRSDMSTGFDITTLSHDGGNNAFFYGDPFDRSGTTHTSSGFDTREFRFGDNGSKLYMLDLSSTTNSYLPRRSSTTDSNRVVINQWDLSTAYDLSTAVNNDKHANLQLSSTTPRTFDISSNGLYIIYPSAGYMYSSTLSTAFDIETAASLVERNVNGQRWAYSGFIDSTDNHAIRWSSDGNYVYTVRSHGGDQQQFSKIALSTTYDLTTASFDISGTAKYLEVLPTSADFGDFPWLTSTPPYYRNLRWANDGYNFYLVESRTAVNQQSVANINIRGFACTTAYDITTATELDPVKYLYNTGPTPLNIDLSHNVVNESVGALQWKPGGERIFIQFEQFIGEHKV